MKSNKQEKRYTYIKKFVMGTNETNMYEYAIDKVYIKNIYNITLIIYETLRI